MSMMIPYNWQGDVVYITHEDDMYYVGSTKNLLKRIGRLDMDTVLDAFQESDDLRGMENAFLEYCIGFGLPMRNKSTLERNFFQSY